MSRFYNATSLAEVLNDLLVAVLAIVLIIGPTAPSLHALGRLAIWAYVTAWVSRRSYLIGSLRTRACAGRRS